MTTPQAPPSLAPSPSLPPTLTPPQIEAWVDSQSALLGLALATAHRPGVLRYAALAAGMAERVMGLNLAIHDEAGSVFAPVCPPADGEAA